MDRDLAILQEAFEVEVLKLEPRGLKYSWQAIFRLIWKSDLVFAWFGSMQFLPILALDKVLRKKIVVVAGGFDVAKDELLKHGAFCESPLRQWLRRLLFGLPDLVLSVSKANQREALQNAKVPEHKSKMIYLGFAPPEKLEALVPFSQRKDQVVMISMANEKVFRLKGIDQLFAFAVANPDIPVKLMGACDDFVRERAKGISNLELLGHLPFRGPKFNQILNESKIALQLSHYESFGAAIVDAAVMGCHPIVTQQFALPEVVGTSGTVVAYGDMAELSRVVRQKMKENCDVTQTQQEFLSKFPLEKRRNELVAAVKSLL